MSTVIGYDVRTVSRPSRIRQFAAGVVAGVIIAFSVPPFGFWPLAIAGVAILAGLLWDQPWPNRAAAGFGAGIGQFGIGIFFVTAFHAIGYLALVLLGAIYAALAGVATAPRRWRLAGLPTALVLAARGREIFPFGGFPLGDLTLGQVGGPLAPIARVGGTLLITAAVGILGTALALGVRTVRARGWRVPAAPLVTVAVVAGVVVVGRVGPDGSGGPAAAPFRVAAVQGGGIRGLRAVRSDAEAVFQRHLTAAQTLIEPPVDLVLWPEDVLDIPGPVEDAPESAQVSALARSLSATVIVGVVEDNGPDHFRNAAVVWAPSGVIVARYDKVHRVPFGEYIPGRGLIRHLADLSIIPRDDTPGHGPGLLRTPSGPLGVMISYEVFFGARARAAVRAGGQALLVPTNASSYRTAQVPCQEVAAARLRAWETGRDVIQAAPTGFTAVIDPEGRVLARSGLGNAQVLQAVVHPRTGRTLFVIWGDRWLVVVAFALLVVAWRHRLGPLSRLGGARPFPLPFDQPVNGGSA